MENGGNGKKLERKKLQRKTSVFQKEHRLVFCFTLNFSNNLNLTFSKLPPIIFEMREIKPQTV